MDKTCVWTFLPRNVLCAEPKNKSLSLGDPTSNAPPHSQRVTLYRLERSSIFATEMTVLFLKLGFEILQTFLNSDSRVSQLPGHLQQYVFDFEAKNFLSSNECLQFHRGNISALFKIRKRLVGEDLNKLAASFPEHCSVILYRMFFTSARFEAFIS